MIQLRSVLTAADNSGAKQLRVIHIHGGSKRKIGRLGDILTCSVIKADSQADLKEGTVVKVILVRTAKEHRRSDGSYIRFDDNAGIVLDNVANKTPKGSRVLGPIAREIKDLGFSKIASQATEIY